MRGRRNQRFGFAGDSATVPVGNRYVARVAKTTESGCAVSEAKWNARCRHEVLQRVDGADWTFSFQSRECVNLLPEAHRIAEFAFGDAAQPLMFFSEDVGAAFLLHGFAIAFQHGAADVFSLKRKTSGLDG